MAAIHDMYIAIVLTGHACALASFWQNAIFVAPEGRSFGSCLPGSVMQASAYRGAAGALHGTAACQDGGGCGGSDDESAAGSGGGDEDAAAVVEAACDAVPPLAKCSARERFMQLWQVRRRRGCFTMIVARRTKPKCSHNTASCVAQF